jgi:hypothetical protein
MDDVTAVTGADVYDDAPICGGGLYGLTDVHVDESFAVKRTHERMLGAQGEPTTARRCS